MNSIRTMGVTAAVAAALIAPAVAAAPALAQDGARAVTATGSCSAGGTWTLKARPDNGVVQVEFEVDTNVSGQVWTVRITDGPATVFSGRRTTGAPSGSFSVAARTADRPGTDVVRAVATRRGASCTGVVRV